MLSDWPKEKTHSKIEIQLENLEHQNRTGYSPLNFSSQIFSFYPINPFFAKLETKGKGCILMAFQSGCIMLSFPEMLHSSGATEVRRFDRNN